MDDRYGRNRSHMEKMEEWVRGGFNPMPQTGIPDPHAEEMEEPEDNEEYEE